MIIGEENGRLIVAKIRDEELAEGAMSRTGLLLVDARCAIFAMRHIESDGAPGGGLQARNLEQFRRAAAQGGEDDAFLIKAIKPFIGGEPGVEHEGLWRTTVLAG